ncbi:MAG: Ig-like domain-containing protein, partial [Pseudomonas sp.]
PVGAGVMVNWTAMAGTLANGSSVTDGNGIATMQLTSSSAVATATVEATAGAARNTANVSFVAGAAATLDLAAAPASIVADGSSASTLTATVKDLHGNSVGAGVQVAWSTTAGQLAGLSSITDATGTATMTLTSSTAVAIATVEASAGAAHGLATVSFTAGEAASVALVATPTAIPADGSSTTTLTASLQDAHGNSVGAGVPVAWSSSAGELAVSSSLTDATGAATMALTSATDVTIATVEASAAAARATTQVSFVAGVPAPGVLGMQLSATPGNIVADGSSTSELRADVRDRLGHPVGPGVVVSWTVTAGSLAGESSVTDADGVATMRLTSANTITTGTVEASAGAARNSLSVNFVAGAPTELSVAATPASLVANGSSHSTLSATVRDVFGNRVGEGVLVNWTTSAGQLAAASSSTNAIGVATVVLTSAKVAGVATVQATAEAAQGSAEVTFTPVTAEHMELNALPLVIAADNHATSLLEAHVSDSEGNEVGEGTEVRWYLTNNSAGAVLDAGTSLTDARGVAQMRVSSPVYRDGVTVNATVGADVQTSLEVSFQIKINLRALLPTLPNAAETLVTALATSGDGMPVKGLLLNWSSATPHLCSLSEAAAITDGAGQARVRVSNTSNEERSILTFIYANLVKPTGDSNLVPIMLQGTGVPP